MMLRFLFVLGALGALGTASGCTSSEPDTLVEYVVKTPEQPGAQVSLDVLKNGHVVLLIFSRPGGTAFKELDAAELANLNAQIRDARFPELATSYGCLGCADRSYYVVTAHIEGHAYEVSIDSAPGQSFPGGLMTLVASLQRLATP